MLSPPDSVVSELPQCEDASSTTHALDSPHDPMLSSGAKIPPAVPSAAPADAFPTPPRSGASPNSHSGQADLEGEAEHEGRQNARPVEEESDDDAEEDLEPISADGMRRRKRKPDGKIRPRYYAPSGTASKGVPVFEPTMDEFADFNAFCDAIDHYGMRAGIVKVVPPKEWTESLPSTSQYLQHIRLREPIAQHFIGSSGLYRVTNMVKSRIWNPKQWKETADSERYATPDFFNRKPSTSTPKTSAAKSSPAVPRSRSTTPAVFDSPVRRNMLGAPSSIVRDTTSVLSSTLDDVPEMKPSDAAVTVDASANAGADVEAKAVEEGHTEPAKASKKYKGTALSRADISDEEWAAWQDEWLKLPHDAKPGDYTVQACQDIERAYWRTLTFGEPPMYGADLKGSIFSKSVKSWNVAHLDDLLTKLGRHQQIPGVNTPYLYFGMWRATFAWHVEDADLYSINYIHFGAPKFWYSVPQAQSERFERVMGGYFPQEHTKCRQFLRHKSFLASPKKLANDGIALNKVVQLPGEFILTYPYGYHSGFNVGYNCAESINFATDAWLDIGRKAKPCSCAADSVKIDVDAWLYAAEQGALDPNRKRSAPEDFLPRPQKKARLVLAPVDPAKAAAAAARKAEKARLAAIAAARPPFVCALCPDLSTDTLVQLAPPTPGTILTTEQQARRKSGAAHKACVMYVPSTYVAPDAKTGAERIFGFDGIERERWKLKCQLCADRYGCPVQCTKTDKCVRAYHVTCALKEESGVVLDAFLTAEGRESSLMHAGDDNDDDEAKEASLSLPSTHADGHVRLVVLCRSHNPEWQNAQQAAKMAKLADDAAQIVSGSRVRARAGGSVYEVTFVGNLPHLAAIDALQDDGKRCTVKYASILWTGAAPTKTVPARARAAFADDYVYEGARPPRTSASRSRVDTAPMPAPHYVQQPAPQPAVVAPQSQQFYHPQHNPQHVMYSTHTPLYYAPSCAYPSQAYAPHGPVPPGMLPPYAYHQQQQQQQR